MQWRTYINSTCLAQQQYRFSYDGANRLTGADHYTNSSGTWTFTNNYTESNITYDLNGNIGGPLWRGKAWAFEQAIGAYWYYRDTNPAMAAMGRTTLERLVGGAL